MGPGYAVQACGWGVYDGVIVVHICGIAVYLQEFMVVSLSK